MFQNGPWPRRNTLLSETIRNFKKFTSEKILEIIQSDVESRLFPYNSRCCMQAFLILLFQGPGYLA